MQDRKLIKSRNLEELGDWDKPLNPAHEALVIKGLVGLCTVLYKGFPTSIQQDRQLLESAAGSPVSSASATQPQASASPGIVSQPHQHNTGTVPTAHDHQQQTLSYNACTAVKFRLGMKQLLETTAKQLLLRLKELTAG